MQILALLDKWSNVIRIYVSELSTKVTSQTFLDESNFQYLVCLLVLKPLTSELQRSVISAGLAQVSEFSFVLASRGRKLQLVNREVCQSVCL